MCVCIFCLCVCVRACMRTCVRTYVRACVHVKFKFRFDVVDKYIAMSPCSFYPRIVVYQRVLI